jgi:hypothetical protein
MHRLPIARSSTRPALIAVVICLQFGLLVDRASPADSIATLLAAVPHSPADLSEQQTEGLIDATQSVERAAAALPWHHQTADNILLNMRRLVSAKQRVDAALDALLDLRTQFAALPAGDQRMQQLRLYLRNASALIDLSGRLRFQLRESIDIAAYYLDPQPAKFRELLDYLRDQNVAVGAEVMAYMLFDPPPEADAKPYSSMDKYKALNLIGRTRNADMVFAVAEFIRQEKDPQLVVIGAELIRRLGLPQDRRPGGDPALPKPAIDASELRAMLMKIEERGLPENLAGFRRDLLAWLDERLEQGIVGDVYRLGRLELRAGDWLLMRNPSPYNQFTDVAPGLFTHVGVVATETGSDGKRRFVIVDLPERGARIPATTVDAYLVRTLSYIFLRHDDPQVGQAMGQAAAEVIGNDSQFDLKFDTSRVLATAGKPLADAKIHTYCAGFLLMCALQTDSPREDFFPIRESCPGGNTAENLARLGLAIGDDFISPTGALFSPRMQIVGFREPMYDPGREVQEAVYDYFAQAMMDKTLTRSPTPLQATRETLAVIAEDIPWLAKALADANDVSVETDLVAAARTASVVETLDEIAEESLNGFAEAQASVMAGEMSGANAARYQPEQIERIASYQSRHADLVRQWKAKTLTPRQLRIELVRFYADRGRQQLDERFFSEPEQPQSE